MKEDWKVTKAKKAAATRKARDPDAFRKMGKLGGAVPRAKPIDDLPIAEQYEPLKSEPK